MRGSQLILYPRFHPAGIIPAHAGLTDTMHHCSSHCRDHPRACGAHLFQELIRQNFRGSSPRMRGSLLSDTIKKGKEGIIPAHAGLTGPPRSGPAHCRDHPRACGAHFAHLDNDEARRGSSPRMRGSRVLFYTLPSGGGIIPAHAGLTSARVTTPKFARDHPRACGAHSK